MRKTNMEKNILMPRIEDRMSKILPAAKKKPDWRIINHR
jgi:hypothetical protein